MTLDELLSGARSHLVFQSLGGSHAYGTAGPDSDQDLRGVYAVPARAYLNLAPPPAQISDERHNEVYYSLRRSIELMAAGNPSLIELLYLPDDCIRLSTPSWELVRSEAALFSTRRAVEAHLGYAYTQIKKARGQNKWINQPQAEQPPARSQYAHVLAADTLASGHRAPARPLPLANSGIHPAHCHVARVEHAPNLYRVYQIGSDARGIYAGDQIAVQPISLEQERLFVGLLIDNEPGWRQAVSDHHNYWTWRRERNEARWRQQEAGEQDFDAKNLMHTVRLLLAGEALLRTGKPIVRFTGPELELLLAIRRGQLCYQDILTQADSIRDRCLASLPDSSLPDACDAAATDNLLQRATQLWESSHALGH
ncbi:MAG: nucleotidyltransferase domain-containing protein [Lysobacterales bacterium]